MIVTLKDSYVKSKTVHVHKYSKFNNQVTL